MMTRVTNTQAGRERLTAGFMAVLPEIMALGLIGLALAWCGALWFARYWFTASSEYFFFLYNLGLAGIPIALSTIATRIRKASLAAPWLGLWLVFFPNAPYLLTDLIHFRPHGAAPFWFDWIFMVSCAGAGLMIACVSLRQVDNWIRDRWGFGWSVCAVGVVLLATGFGIYLGRFPRWNSWDPVTRPREFFGHVAELLLNAWDHPRMLAFSFGVTVILGFGYLACMLASFERAPREKARHKIS